MVHPSVKTHFENAWQFRQHITVRLIQEIEGVRAHTNSRTLKPNENRSDPQGAWIAIDDYIETSAQYRSSRALQGSFTHTAWAKVPVGCVLNIGFAAPLFGMPGGGPQAEFVSGPPIRFDQTTNKWHSKHGNA
jgi:hypothetical protein